MAPLTHAKPNISQVRATPSAARYSQPRLDLHTCAPGVPKESFQKLVDIVLELKRANVSLQAEFDAYKAQSLQQVAAAHQRITELEARQVNAEAKAESHAAQLADYATVENALATNPIHRQNLSCHRDIITPSGAAPCQPTPAAVAKLLGVSEDSLIHVSERPRPTPAVAGAKQPARILRVTFSDHKAASHATHSATSHMPRGTYMQYRRTHLERVSYALVKQLEHLCSTASPTSVLQKVTFHVRQARIFIRHANAPYEVPYPMHQHIPMGDMFAALPIQFTNLTLDTVEAFTNAFCERLPSFDTYTSAYTTPTSSLVSECSSDGSSATTASISDS